MNLIPSISAPTWAAGLKVITIKCTSCHRSMALRQFSARKAGIKMRDSWYCSSACFTNAAEKEFSKLMRPGLELGTHQMRTPLGLVLVSQGLLTNAQLRAAADEQRRNGGEIGDLLVQRGSVTERQVTAVRAAQWGCPVFTAPKHMVRDSIYIPFSLIKLYSAVPLHYAAAKKLLLVGFTHGVEYGLLYAIEQMTGCKTQPCFVTPSDFQDQMKPLEESKEKAGGTNPREVEIEALHSAKEMASILCNYCVDLEAEDVVIVKCKEYFWARILSRGRETDLLFRAG